LDVGDDGAENAADADSANINLTERQKSVLERLGRGDSNKAIARLLGIREGTVKVHVRQIMRKLGVVNRTQVAIACANGARAEMRADDRSIKDKIELASGHTQFGVSLANGKA
jgi:DNA-binding CsgD family transcriptional regulator